MDPNPYESPQHGSAEKQSLAERPNARLVNELAAAGGCLIQLAGMFLLAIMVLAVLLAAMFL